MGCLHLDDKVILKCEYGIWVAGCVTVRDSWAWYILRKYSYIYVYGMPSMTVNGLKNNFSMKKIIILSMIFWKGLLTVKLPQKTVDRGYILDALLRREKV